MLNPALIADAAACNHRMHGGKRQRENTKDERRQDEALDLRATILQSILRGNFSVVSIMADQGWKYDSTLYRVNRVIAEAPGMITRVRIGGSGNGCRYGVTGAGREWLARYGADSA